MVRNAERGLFVRRPGAAAPLSPTSAGRRLRARRSGRRRSSRRHRACGGPRGGLAEAVVDLMLQRMRGAEHQHPTRADRHFLAGLRVAADPLTLLAHGETAERGDLDHLAALERTGNLGDHRFDEFGRLVAREANLLIDRFGELSASNRFSGHDALPAFGKVRPAEKPRQIPKRCPRFSGVRSYQRTTLAPQVSPPPSASIRIRCPGRMRPSVTASSRASGIEAAEVLAWRSIVTTVFPAGSPSRRPTASMIRVFAWFGTSQSISAPLRPFAASASSTTSLRC